MTIDAVTPRPLEELYRAVNNWGRWGDDDERGTLNLITAAKIRQAAATVAIGRVVPCGQVDEMRSELNAEPPEHRMLTLGAGDSDGCGITSDFFGIAPHGSMITHIDALCHISFDGQLYNGRSASLVDASGAAANSLAAATAGIMTRGILLDIPSVRDVDYIEPGEPVTCNELVAAERAAGVEIGPGDALLVRVGRHARRNRLGNECERDADGNRQIAGLHRDCLEWLHAKGIALLCSDGGNDALPSPQTRDRMPIHVGCIVFIGLHLIDNLDLEELRSACVEANRFEFQFSVAPLTFARATGSPVNPIAVL